MVCISVRRRPLWNLLPIPKTSNDRISKMSFLSTALCVLFKGTLPCVAPHSDVPTSWELSHVLLQTDLGSVFGGYTCPSQRLFLSLSTVGNIAVHFSLHKGCSALLLSPLSTPQQRGESNSCLANQVIRTNRWSMGNTSEPENLHTIPFGVSRILLGIVDQGLCYVYFCFVIKKDLGFHSLKMF